MSKDQAPSFPFYARDFITDKKVLLMSLAERGAYITLLCHLWLEPEPGVIADHDDTLSVLPGAGVLWPEMRPRIVAAFDTEMRPGFLIQKRMFEERVDQAIRYRKAVAGGKKRWQEVTDEDREEHARLAATARWEKKNAR